ncbi:MAG: hypothetical protein AVDCRST_MAG03-656, partial [uncultured Rubrobacteraceae bacterium]
GRSQGARQRREDEFARHSVSPGTKPCRSAPVSIDLARRLLRDPRRSGFLHGPRQRPRPDL